MMALRLSYVSVYWSDEERRYCAMAGQMASIINSVNPVFGFGATPAEALRELAIELEMEPDSGIAVLSTAGPT